MTETSVAYAGGFAVLAGARIAGARIAVAPSLTVEAADAGLLNALHETLRRVLFARAAEARLTRRLGDLRVLQMAHEDLWEGEGEPPIGWQDVTAQFDAQEAEIRGRLIVAQDARRALGDLASIDLAWASPS